MCDCFAVYAFAVLYVCLCYARLALIWVLSVFAGIFARQDRRKKEDGKWREMESGIMKVLVRGLG
jgi:hypothetical protein